MSAGTNGHTSNGTKPAWLKVNADNIPAELKLEDQWVCWEARPGKAGRKPRKLPVDPVNRRSASCDDPSTWNRFEQCLRSYGQKFPRYAGIGFQFSVDDEYAGIDLDHCRNPETVELNPTAQAILDTIKSYAEVSPSGTGIKLIVRGKLPAGIKHKAAFDGIEVETYDQGRYFALTGHVVDDEHQEIIEAQTDLDAIVARIQEEHQSKAQAPHVDSGQTDDDRFRRALKRAISIPCKKENDGSRRLLKCCYIAVELDLSDSEAYRLVGEVHRLAAFPAEFSEADILRRVRDAEAKTTRGKGVPSYRSSANAGESNKFSLYFADARTERANASRFTKTFGGTTRFCDPWDKWLTYNGRQWEVDQCRIVEARAKTVVAELWDQVAEINKAADSDDKLKQAVTAFAKSSNSANGVRNLLALAKSEPGIPVMPNQLDAQPWLLNLENCTIDLSTGTTRPHSRDDLITKIAPVAYGPAAKCPRWLAFLMRVMDGRQSLISFLQRAVGMSLTGVVRDHCLLFCYGVGANGKSVYLNTIKAMLGEDYALKAPPELLLVKPQGGVHPTEMASLHGKRFVSAIEVDDGRRFAEATVKELCGGDPITTRRLYEDFWTFNPSHHIWVAANHRPIIRGTDTGIWRRIRLIPFTVAIPPDEQDKELSEKLLGELPGILNWALQGCRDWQDYGLHEPSEVEAATKEYRADMDVIGEFINEKCALGKSYTIKASDLYADFKAWAIEAGEYLMSQRKFGMKLTERGIDRYTNNGTFYRGIDLQSHLKF